jgi:hypothetical protein
VIHIARTKPSANQQDWVWPYVIENEAPSQRFRAVRVDQVEIHPLYTAESGDQIASHDIALIRLQNPVSVPFAAFMPDPLSATYTTFAGWGLLNRRLDATADRPVGVGQANIRAVEQISKPGDTRIRLRFGDARNCFGDSGGPLFAGIALGYKDEIGQHAIMAVISAIDNEMDGGASLCNSAPAMLYVFGSPYDDSWICKVTSNEVGDCGKTGRLVTRPAAYAQEQ